MATEESKMSGNGPESEPVEILNNEAARLYSYAYPGIVFGLFSVRFGATVADPISSLSQLLLSVCILQAIYMSMCLPAATSMRPSLPSQSTSITEPSPQQQQQDQKLPSTRPSFPISYLTTKIHPAILSTLLALCVSTPLLTVLIILLGAPITTNLPQTILTGAHISLLALGPIFYTHGVSTPMWQINVRLDLPVDEVIGAAFGTFAGAWIGAVPIPLDWDREWQKWPVTIVTGAYTGWSIGKLAGGTVFKGRRIKSGVQRYSEEWFVLQGLGKAEWEEWHRMEKLYKGGETPWWNLW